jgi:hypothetical chaperone protein
MTVNIGLDFGTSNSGVAVSDGRKVHVLPIDRQNILPQVVKTILYITRDDQAYIGQEAVELYYKHNVNRLRRFVKKWTGEIDYTGGDMYYVTDVYTLVDELLPGRLMQYLKTALRRTHGTTLYSGTQIFERYYTVGDLIRVYLSALKTRAENELGDEIGGVTLGRPVKFSETPALDRQAQETLRQAAINAGFKAVDFELEPVAAALFYEQTLDHPQTVLVFDFGGGTLDIAILRLGDPQQRTVYASAGIDIAGSDFDRTIIEKRMLPHFGSEGASGYHEIMELIRSVPDWMTLPELSTPQIWNALQRAIQKHVAPVRLKTLQSLIFNDLAFSFYNQVESAKIALSSRGASIISLEAQDIDLWELYTRRQFEMDIKGYQQTIEKLLLDTVESAGMEPGQIDAVVKTGGSASIPVFIRMLQELFGREKVIESNTFSSVTSGLAIRAWGGSRV